MSALAGCRVLVVEDDALIAMDVEGSIRDFGCHVIGPFGSIAAALAAVGTEQPDCAVIDLNLNGHPALALADALALAQVPFLFLSGHSANVVPQRHRARPFVGKPYEVSTLRGALTELCSRKGSRTVR
jgi:DNA-binding response OmpR family regulator